MSQKVILCGADKLAELSGGVVNILDNTIGSEETNICIFDSFATSDSQVPSDNEIIQQNMLRDFGGGVKTTEIRREGNRIKSVLVKIGASAPTLVMINKHYQKFIIINQINTLVDWILGIFQSVACFMANFDDPGAGRMRATSGTCLSVCGDKHTPSLGTQRARACRTPHSGAAGCSSSLTRLEPSSISTTRTRFSL